MRQQPFASPEEALIHYGKKGMKWGVVNEDKEVGSDQSIARRNEVEKNKLSKELSSKDSSDRKKLSPNQKKALIGAGIGVVAIGGFIAYKHYSGGSAPKVGGLTDWGNPFPKKPDMSELRLHPLSTKRLGALGQEGSLHGLKNPEGLILNTSKGYADWLPVGGFANADAAARHASLSKSIEGMREKYPSIRNMNIELVPMSHGHGMESRLKTVAASADNIGDGEARLYYNDQLGKVTKDLSSFIPGFRDPDHLGTHEMGHVLAGAHGEVFTRTYTAKLRSLAKASDATKIIDDMGQAQEKYHGDLFKKHGITFDEISKLGGYAASSRVEGLAELSAYVHSPGLRRKLSPELLKKAESLFNEMGGS